MTQYAGRPSAVQCGIEEIENLQFNKVTMTPFKDGAFLEPILDLKADEKIRSDSRAIHQTNKKGEFEAYFP